MRLQELYDFLDTMSPFELQEKWDNSGLIIGEMSREITSVVVSIDIDMDMINSAKDGTVFIVHHPLIFDKLNQLNFAKYPSNLIEKIILKKQSLIALHTNFDKTHLNKYVFTNILGFKLDSKEDFICTTNEEWNYKSLLKHIKEKLDLPTLKVVGKKEKISSIALTTGAGASMIDKVKADCFLTGDIKYHDAIKAMNEDLMMIEIGHYESEKFFSEIVVDKLKVLPILAIISNSKNPFLTEEI